MATLKAMFKLFDGYSSTINKIIGGTDKATKGVLSASKGTDKYNDSLKNTGASASVANSGLTKLIGTVATLATVKKTMDLTDTYTNTAARLKMINDGTQTQLELQNKVFAAADRARGSYTDMASAVAKMNLLAGDSFGSNDEAIGFTELLQKSLKVSGAGQSEQDSAFLQLTQAMAAGKLQGDEYRSVMENAPMAYQAIVSYMEKTMGVAETDIKELASDGAITADIIKNAMFAASDDINAMFDTMPMTFADAWTKIKNTGNQAFGGVFERLNKMLSSEMGQTALNNLTGIIYGAAEACDALLDGLEFISDNLDILGPIILGVAGAWAVYNATSGIAWLTTLKNVGAMALKATADWAETAAIIALIWAQEGFNAALAACPITWIIIGIIAIIAIFYAAVAAVNHFAGTSISATGLIGGAIGVLVAWVSNQLILMYNQFAIVANFIGNVFTNPVAAIKVLFYDMAITVLGYMQSIAKGIEGLINAIPGVEIDITSKMDNFIGGLKKKSQDVKDASGWKEYVKTKEFINLDDGFKGGYSLGSGLEDKASNLFAGFKPESFGGGGDFSQFATAGNPAVVKGNGQGGAVKVENKEDIEWMRKLAERDYVARIAQNTLAPNIKVEFTGPITKEADVDGVAAHLGDILKEQIATAPEGVYI
ncbi:tape measure protein [Lacrimispora sp.]|uniref:tape measure protein n=1 Tax=Lacrimispora sp. TaxID=2719234 RepID=UPI003460720B